MDDPTLRRDGGNPDDLSPGERPPAGRHLAAPPSDRYGSAAGASSVPRGATGDSSPKGASGDSVGAGSPRSPVARAVLVSALISLLGASAMVLLAGVLGLTAGLLAAVALTGIAIGRTMRGAGPALRPSMQVIVALIFVLDAVALGNIATWLYALTEGGVLGPIEYLSEAFGPLVIAELVVGGTAAILASR